MIKIIYSPLRPYLYVSNINEDQKRSLFNFAVFLVFAIGMTFFLLNEIGLAILEIGKLQETPVILNQRQLIKE